jgi:hypothetical protein
VNLHTDLSDLNQAFSGSNPSIEAETNPADNLVDRRQDANFPQPQITPYLDENAWCEVVSPAPHPDHSAAASTSSEHAASAQQLGEHVIERLRMGKATKLPSPMKPVRPRITVRRSSQSRSLKPVRAARARAVHSHSAHGGARKAGDDGDGGDGEPPTKPDHGMWGTAASYSAAKRCGFLDPIPRPRPGYAFVNANCECWRRQFSNLFCTKCTPVDRREVPVETVRS